MNDMSQIIYAMGALILFGTFALSTQRSLINNDQRSYLNDIQNEAIYVAETMVREAMETHFDRNTANGPLPDNDPSHLRPTPTFGLPSDKTEPDYFEEYHKHTQTYSGVYGVYTVRFHVEYVNYDTPVKPVFQRTLRKRLTVNVTTPALSRPVTLQYIRSYH